MRHRAAGSQPDRQASHGQPTSIRRTTTAAKRNRPNSVIHSGGCCCCVVASRRTGRRTRNKIGKSDTARPTVSRTAASWPPFSRMASSDPKRVAVSTTSRSSCNRGYARRLCWRVLLVEKADLPEESAYDRQLDCDHRLEELHGDHEDHLDTPCGVRGLVSQAPRSRPRRSASAACGG